MSIIVNLLIVLLSIVYWIYTGQFEIGATFLLLYFAGFAMVGIYIRNKCSANIYSFFFLIYGILMIISQYLFIDGVNLGYFVHSDASGSFYVTATVKVGPSRWENLVSGTILRLFFADYPLFAFWINLWKLIGYDIGITTENLRLFLRLQDLLFAPGILAIMAKYFLELGWSRKKTFRWCVVFGLFTYLFLTSVVYTRDLHLAFFYTLAGYYCLSPQKHRLIYLKFLLIIIICFGLRPENGMFAVIFPVYYRLRDVPPTVKLFIVGLIFLGIVVALGYIDKFIASKESYNNRTLAYNKGGLYSLIQNIPFPLSLLINNYTFNPLYSLIMPFPLIFYIEDTSISWMGLTSLVMPFINLIMVFSIIYYIRRHKKEYRTLYFFIICVLYFVMCCTVEPNVRRSFAAIPSLYMLFAYVRPKLTNVVFRRIKLRAIVFLVCLNIPAILYLMIKGKL